MGSGMVLEEPRTYYTALGNHTVRQGMKAIFVNSGISTSLSEAAPEATKTLEPLAGICSFGDL